LAKDAPGLAGFVEHWSRFQPSMGITMRPALRLRSVFNILASSRWSCRGAAGCRARYKVRVAVIKRAFDADASDGVDPIENENLIPALLAASRQRPIVAT